MTSNGNEVNDDNKFSTPMPMIGLNMAVATLVCLVLMLCDIFSAIRQRKPWIPCRFFVLNSFSLTLLSVATKLPVDLTTSMPSAYDQLSKLCGTSLICISIVREFEPRVSKQCDDFHETHRKVEDMEMEPSKLCSGNIKSFVASHDVEKDKESAGGTSFGSKNHVDDNLVFPTTNDDAA
ncbi:hypothetical protein Syun_030588 [Stephania yunnanensis]|uniref:Uncharacterized protein n=1 Tax=Stephania yunnanensis TaxID=152371 RepID=A0AAP0HFQ9_9MAGN